MSTGGASKHPANETQKEASPKIMKEKLYSGVVYEPVDEDKQNKSRYHLWKQKYVGDHIRDPQPLPPSKKPKPGEVQSSSSLSTALGYIISPVKYLASAFTSSSSEPEKPLEKPKNKHGYSYKIKDPSPRRLEAPPRQTAADDKSHTLPNTALKSLEAPVRALKTIPLSEITAANSAQFIKSRSGTPTTHSKDKKPADKKQKPGSTKKVHEIKKSQSQQIKGSPKVFKSYSPPRNLETLPVISNTRLISASDLKIVQSNHTAFRVVSREDANANSDADALVNKLDLNPALASKSNNSNIVCQLSPMMAPLHDELCFVDDTPQMLLAYPVQNCSNSVSNNWNFPESTGNKYAFRSESGYFRNRSHSSLSFDLSTQSNLPALDNISCDREAIETIFSGNLLTQCTPTQLLSGHKPQSRTPFAHESLDSVDLRETLLVNDNTQRSRPSHKTWQPLKDYEGDLNIIIVPTGPTLKKRSPFTSPKNSPTSSSKFQKTSKPKPPVTTKRKASKQYSARNLSPSSPRTGQAKFLSHTSKSLLPARPSSSPGLTLKRTTVSFHTVPKKTVEIKKEEIKKDEIKKEEIKKEDIKKDEIKKEEVKKEVVKKEEIKKTSPPTSALKTAAISVAATAVPEAITKAATSEVLGAGRATFSNTEEKAVNETAPHATVPPTERPASTQGEESWLAHAIRSLSPKRKEPPHNFNSETEPQPPTTPPRQPSIPSSNPPVTPAGANTSPNVVTITSVGASIAEPDTRSTQGGASMTASAMREALKFTSAVREAMKMSHSANFLGKKHLSSLISRAEYDQEKQDDYPKYFSAGATLHGEFP